MSDHNWLACKREYGGTPFVQVGLSSLLHTARRVGVARLQLFSAWIRALYGCESEANYFVVAVLIYHKFLPPLPHRSSAHFRRPFSSSRADPRSPFVGVHDTPQISHLSIFPAWNLNSVFFAKFLSPSNSFPRSSLSFKNYRPHAFHDHHQHSFPS